VPPEAKFRGKPSISLTGFMFTGKSSVGRRLARILKLEFIDLDEEIACRAGRSIPEIFELGGEEEFRRIEHQALSSVIPVPGRVTATGGGVVCNPANRRILLEHSCVVWLTATPKTVLQRFRRSRGKPRPLLEVPDPEAKIGELLAARNEDYRECHLQVATDGCSVKQVCRKVLAKLNEGQGQ
jgi:shikimate kinase